MIKNVIFDIGNVLLDFCWKDHIARFGFQGEKADRIAQAMMLGPIWPKLDLGLESDEDILEQFVTHTPELEQEIRLVFSDLSTIVREYEGSVDWIESLKARGYPPIICPTMVNGSAGKHQRNCLSCRIWTAASCPIRFIWQSRIRPSIRRCWTGMD